MPAAARERGLGGSGWEPGSEAKTPNNRYPGLGKALNTGESQARYNPVPETSGTHSCRDGTGPVSTHSPPRTQTAPNTEDTAQETANFPRGSTTSAAPPLRSLAWPLPGCVTSRGWEGVGAGFWAPSYYVTSASGWVGGACGGERNGRVCRAGRATVWPARRPSQNLQEKACVGLKS